MFLWSGICLVFLLLYFYSSLCFVILSDVSIRAVHSLISLFTLFQSLVLSFSVSGSLSSCPFYCPWLITQTCSLNWEQTETDNLFFLCHTFLTIHLFCFVLCRFFVFLRLSLVIRNNTSCSSLSPLRSNLFLPYLISLCANMCNFHYRYFAWIWIESE